MSEDLVRVSHSDREHAVASLREHLVQGRLSLEEFHTADVRRLQRDHAERARRAAALWREGDTPLVRVNALDLFAGVTVKVTAPK